MTKRILGTILAIAGGLLIVMLISGGGVTSPHGRVLDGAAGPAPSVEPVDADESIQNPGARYETQLQRAILYSIPIAPAPDELACVSSRFVETNTPELPTVDGSGLVPLVAFTDAQIEELVELLRACGPDFGTEFSVIELYHPLAPTEEDCVLAETNANDAAILRQQLTILLRDPSSQEIFTVTRPIFVACGLL